MQSLNDGYVYVTLKSKDGQEHKYELRPTFRAIQSVQNFFTSPGDLRGPMQAARERCAGQDLAAIAFIIRTGANLPDKQGRDLPELVYENGLDADLIIPLMRFVAILANGGRPLPDDPDAGTSDDDSAKNF